MEPNYDSIMTAVDSNVLNSSEFYKTGELMPDRDIPVAERSYAVSNDDYIVGGMAVMFFVLAAILYRSRHSVLYHIKEFFATKRQYTDENSNDNSSEANNVFMLTTISALSLSLVFFDKLADEYSFNQALGVPYWVFGIGFVLFMCFIYAKAWLYTLINWVFFDAESSKKWIAGYLLVTSLTAFILYPLSLVEIFFSDSWEIVIWGAILVAIIYEALLFYKLLTNFKIKKYGYLLIFLYFCSVELMPALILWNGLGWISDSIIVKNLLY
ncbi:MAG: DUF4271 domain-containing protein [Prevotellaceae bacterium]|nr:DUF4271 domain-containing protein [Candidatus Minthosoma caballi]